MRTVSYTVHVFRCHIENKMILKGIRQGCGKIYVAYVEWRIEVARFRYHKLGSGKNCDISNFMIWAASWQNQKNDCAPNEDSDQPGHPPSLIRVFAVRMKKAWVRSFSLSAQRRLWSDWADAQIWVIAGCIVILFVLSCRGSYDGAQEMPFKIITDISNDNSCKTKLHVVI